VRSSKDKSAEWLWHVPTLARLFGISEASLNQQMVSMDDDQRNLLIFYPEAGKALLN